MHAITRSSIDMQHAVAKKTGMALVAAALLLAAIGLAGCGSSGAASGSPGGEVVAEVGGSPITRAAVSHWMGTLAGGDYYELSASHTLPAGLVSDPPNYAACVSRLQAAVAGNARAASSLTATGLLTKCRQINLALRIQAAAFLVQAQSLTSIAREEGIVASEQEVQALFRRTRAEQYPTEADLRQHLASTRSSLADELVRVKEDVLEQRITKKLTAGGQQAAAEFAALQQSWTAKTSCSAGYVVEHCKQFKGTQIYPGGLSAAVLMEKVAALLTGRCTNLQACAKQ
jgi:hypothetical protein